MPVPALPRQPRLAQALLARPLQRTCPHMRTPVHTTTARACRRR
jgi:hypothetical protein